RCVSRASCTTARPTATAGASCPARTPPASRFPPPPRPTSIDMNAHALLSQSAGARFRAAVNDERPLSVVGAINAYTARMAERAGFKALYLPGAGVAANSLGMPDLGISTLDDVLTDVRRITEVTTLPLLVDVDTGWGGAFNIPRTLRSFIKAGAGAVAM